MKQQDWHSADVIAALKKRGTSLAAVSRAVIHNGAGISTSNLLLLTRFAAWSKLN
ncbi:hypothetical protein SOASR031_34800 [Leminorella grimontii]|nr:hypothetical protein SOASR031_34800 [Leminorella grimontii]